MSLLEITINAGSAAGQRIRVNRSPARFGRDPENELVIDLPTVSRVHGELRYDNGTWLLVNRSPNGTTLNRRGVGRKPKAVADGDQIVVGDEAVMTVSLRADEGFAAPAASGAAGADEAASAGEGGGTSARTKLWLGIAGFWAVIFTLAFIFIDTGEPEETGGIAEIPMLTDEQIEQAVRGPLPTQEQIPRYAVQYFNQAESAYQMRGADSVNLFRAYHAYKTALSYAFGDDFTDPRDDWGGKPPEELALAQKRMFELEQELIETLQRLYKDAYGKLQDRRFREAFDAFGRVMEHYAVPQNEVYRNAVRQRDVARRRAET